MTIEVVADKIISFEDFLEHYMGQHVEWENGYVVEVHPVAISKTHHKLLRFLIVLFSHYLEETEVGVMEQDPFIMRLENAARAPDVMVILNHKLARLHETYFEGAPDLVVEVVSPESAERDKGQKLSEYQNAGIQEYWIIDPWEKEAFFYVLDENKSYQYQSPNAKGIYTSQVLPHFNIPVAHLFTDDLLNTKTAYQLVQNMLTG